jgi:hypothetical protein
LTNYAKQTQFENHPNERKSSPNNALQKFTAPQRWEEQTQSNPIQTHFQPPSHPPNPKFTRRGFGGQTQFPAGHAIQNRLLN